MSVNLASYTLAHASLFGKGIPIFALSKLVCEDEKMTLNGKMWVMKYVNSPGLPFQGDKA